jgi:hypothetical protein
MQPNPLLSLLPLLTVSIVFFVFAIPISKRKAKSIGLAFLCLVPFLGLFVLLYLASLTDKAVVDRLAALEGRLH